MCNKHKYEQYSGPKFEWKSSEAVKLTGSTANESYRGLGLGLELEFNLSLLYGCERTVGLAAMDDSRSTSVGHGAVRRETGVRGRRNCWMMGRVLAPWGSNGGWRHGAPLALLDRAQLPSDLGLRVVPSYVRVQAHTATSENEECFRSTCAQVRGDYRWRHVTVGPIVWMPLRGVMRLNVTSLLGVAVTAACLTFWQPGVRASEFPERECCDPVYPPPVPTAPSSSAATPTGRSGLVLRSTFYVTLACAWTSD
ncbi:hypothetical protein CBL_13283 [Carabus blaptoides fortunei]